MTVTELKLAVARLGFSGVTEDGDELLRDAAARALDELCAVRPRLCHVSLWHLPSPPLYYEGGEERITGEKTVSLPSGCSFFLRVTGRGELTIYHDKSETKYAFLSKEEDPPATIGGELPKTNAPLTFRFTAEGAYRILCFAVYDAYFAEMPPDPMEVRRYRLASLFPSFGSLAAPPTTRDGRVLTEGVGGDYTVEEGNILALSPHAAGDIHLTYRKQLTLPEKGQIPVSEEEAALIPLFCAGYIYLEDDPEKASFYLSRFRDGLLRLRDSAGGLHRYRDTNSWG